MKHEELKNLINDISYQVYNSVLKGNSGFMPQVDKRLAILETHFEDILNTLKRIEEQTLKTNGRVSILENWRSYIIGGMAAFSIVFGLVFYIWQSNISELKTEQNVITKSINDLINKK